MNQQGGAPPQPGRSLSPGDRLGPYEIVRPLGAGGMGEVYRARDSRLRRDVAVKILHPSLSLTPDHVERLTREARAAGSLNHPNIVAVYDVGTEGAVPYIVSELLEGESLRSRLNRGSLPYRKALDYGIQLAHALGAAHERGVWHRDVKPGNAFITAAGRIKLLDFGLVKLRPQEGRRSEDPTADDTRPGGIHGTAGYMSPEQALGQAIDHRTDLFALGAVLYEMLVGIPAFRRSSAVDTMRAVLNEDPPDLLLRDPTLPRSAAAAVYRCLEKNKEERFQSARDLGFHLQQLQEAVEAGSPSPPSARRWTIRLATLAALALAVTAAFVPRWGGPPTVTFDQLTFRRARIGGARFASDGGAVVYSEAREGRPPDVWLLNRLDSPESLRLDYGPKGGGAEVLAVHGNRIALSLEPRFLVGERFVGTVAEAPIGGAAHALAANVEDADWDAVGKQLAVARSLVGGSSRLEYPPGTIRYNSADSIRWPRFSRDGRRIAFIEDPTGRGVGGRVVIVDLEQNATPLTAVWDNARGLAWSPSGDEVWFAAGAFRGNRGLRAVNLKGRDRLVLEAPASLTLWDISTDGRLLLSRDEERSALVGVPPGETAERDLSWFDTSGLADLSRDGRKLLFGDRFGVYIRSTDGSTPPERLTIDNGFGDAFSPDGTKVLATVAGGQQLVMLPAGPGDPLPLPQFGINTHRGALWFPDGRRILFNGGPEVRSYEQSLDGGPPRALTPKNIWTTAISPDGQWLATIQSRDEQEEQSSKREAIELWPVAGGAPRPVRSSIHGDRAVAWSDDGRWLWVFRRGEVPAEVSRLEIDTGRRQLWKELTPPDTTGVHSITDFKVTRDGRAYFYSYKRVTSQLYVVSGLK